MKIEELAKEAIEQGNSDIGKALDDIRERLNFCWSKTVEREEENE